MLVGLLSSCTMKKSDGTSKMNLTGEITPLGMTTFQYGTHTIRTENKIYALKSTSIKLDDYLNKLVILQGEKVRGYPLEGGPELIEVSEISVK